MIRKPLALVVACLALTATSVSLASEGDSSEGQIVPIPPPTQLNPIEPNCESEFTALARRVWSPGRWDWFDATPITRHERRKLAELRGCADRHRRIWKKQRGEFENYWLQNRLRGLFWLLAATRSCESGGNYRINTGNGYTGAYQFDDDSWHGAGGSGSAYTAPPREQDYRAVVWRGMSNGSDPWPNCPL